MDRGVYIKNVDHYFTIILQSKSIDCIDIRHSSLLTPKQSRRRGEGQVGERRRVKP